MSKDYSLNFINLSQLGLPQSIESLLAQFVIKHFKIASLSVGEYPEAMVFLKTTNSDDTEIDLTPAYQRGQISLLLRDTVKQTDGFSMWMNLYWDPRQIGSGQIYGYVPRLAKSVFKNKESSHFYSQRLLEIGRIIYSILKPLFGCIDQCGQSALTKNCNQLATTKKVSHVYWANFWNEEIVMSFDQVALSSLPVGQVYEMEDRGLLYLISSDVKATTPNNVSRTLENHLKVSVRCPEKIK